MSLHHKPSSRFFCSQFICSGFFRSLFPANQASTFFRLILACIVTMLALSTVFMNQSIFLDIANSFDVTAQKARFSFGVISLCYSFTFLFIGPLADTFDYGKMTAFGHFFIALFLMIAAGLNEYSEFLGCVGFIGIAAAVVPASMFPYVSQLAPPSGSGIYIGSIVASATLGIVIGRVALGTSTDAFGWQNSYRYFSLLFAFLSIISFFFLMILLQESGQSVKLLLK